MAKGRRFRAETPSIPSRQLRAMRHCQLPVSLEQMKVALRLYRRSLRVAPHRHHLRLFFPRDHLNGLRIEQHQRQQEQVPLLQTYGPIGQCLRVRLHLGHGCRSRPLARRLMALCPTRFLNKFSLKCPCSKCKCNNNPRASCLTRMARFQDNILRQRA